MEIFSKKKIRKLIGLAGGEGNRYISRSITELFDKKQSLYLLLLGIKTPGIEDLDIRVEAALSSEMNQFRHLLHPYRLSIMKIMNEEDIITSAELKLKMDMTWGVYYNNMNALQKLGLVKIYEDFDEAGIKKQFVRIEEIGRKQYLKLVASITKFVDMVNESIPDFSRDQLYP